MGKSNLISPLGKRKRDTIPSNSTKAIEEFALSKFRLLKYFVTFYNSDNDTTKSMEVTVKKSGNSITSMVGNRDGIGIDLAVQPSVNGLNFEMNVENKEGYDVNVAYSRLTIF